MATSTFSIAELKLDTTVRGLALARLSSASDDSAAVAAAGVASFIVRSLTSLKRIISYSETGFIAKSFPPETGNVSLMICGAFLDD
jgi:hypothetical protein